MRCAYHPDYYVPLPATHPFPMAKYPRLYERLRAAGWLVEPEVIEPVEAALDDLRLVHTDEYLGQLSNGTLDAAAVRRIGVPWSAALWRRSRLAAQGTLEAARAALVDGLAANLAGGTHHAFADHGEGFCVLNDVAVAIRVLQRDARIRRALVIDLDVHQGNGTATSGCRTASVTRCTSDCCSNISRRSWLASRPTSSSTSPAWTRPVATVTADSRCRTTDCGDASAACSGPFARAGCRW